MSESKWMDIETAPKDGTRILVATGAGGIALSWWLPRHGGFYAGSDSFGPHTWTTFGTSALAHWQPLPAPPEDA